MSLTRSILAALVAATLIATPAAAAQEPPPLMKVDLIVPASGYVDGRVQAEDICAVLPDGTASVTIARRALVDAAGTDRPLTVTILPYSSTANALVAAPVPTEPLTLTIPGLAGATCFGFENPLSARQAADVAQAYRYFAQVVTIEAR